MISGSNAESERHAQMDHGAALMAIVQGEGTLPRLAGAALHVTKNGKTLFSEGSGCAHFKEGQCERALTGQSKLRVASVSKVAVALAIENLRQQGTIDLDTDISQYLQREVRHPAHKHQAVTVRHLLSHTSTIRDPEEYWITAPGHFTSLFDGEGVFETERNDAPGAYFSYANLNYGLLAEIIERTSNMRFDAYVEAHVMQQLGLKAGFNWSGVSQADREAAATLYRKENGVWVSQIDDADALAQTTPLFLRGDGVDPVRYLNNYQPGDNPTLFSPQGGLRASVGDMAVLVTAAAEAAQLATPVWSLNNLASNGDHNNRMFARYGAGLHVIDANQEIGSPAMIGHSGEAYGLNSGAWVIKDDQSGDEVVISFAINGIDGEPIRSVHPSFYQSEYALLQLAMDIAGLSHPANVSEVAHSDEEHTSPEARPFHKEADARLDVEAALRASSYSGRPALLVLGANWCHDSRGFAGKVAQEPLKSFVADHFHLVYVDVGHRDRNLSIASRFGISELLGTPTILIVSPDGALLNEDTVHDWRTAYSRSADEVENYLRNFTSDASNVTSK